MNLRGLLYAALAAVGLIAATPAIAVRPGCACAFRAARVLATLGALDDAPERDAMNSSI